MLRVFVLCLAMLTTWATVCAQSGAPQAEGARKPAALQRPALAVARPAQAVLLAVTRAGKRLVAAGERGLVIVSDDDGRQWKQASVPVSVTLTALRFASDREGWAVGNMGVVLRTLDGGETWHCVLDGQLAADIALKAAKAAGQGSGAASSSLLEDAQRLVAEGADKPFLDIALRPDGSALAVGAYGLAFSSSDGGKSWRPQMQALPNPESLSYYGLVEREGEKRLFGEQGLLLRSVGGVGSFTPEASPSDGSLFGALALREGPVLLLGLRGKAWRSAEAGAPWQLVKTPVDASLLAGLQLGDGTVLLAGAAGQVLFSHDQGREFRVLPLKLRFPFTGLAEAADGALVLVGTRGVQRMAPSDLKTSLEAIGDTRYPGAPRLSERDDARSNAS